MIGISVARLLGSPGPALAASSPAAEAESLIHDGVALRRQHHDEEALPLFQKAYDLLRNPRIAGYLGQCELSLGYWIEAEQHLSEALLVPRHPWVEQNHASLAASLKRARDNIGALSVTGAPDGAQIYVNGRAMGQLPLPAPLRLARGLADVELRAAGYLTARRSVSVTAEAATLDIRLESEHRPVASVSTHGEDKLPARLPESSAGTPREQPSAAADPGAARPGQSLRWAAITTAVLGAAALVAAGVETVRWQRGIADFNSHSVNGMQDCQATEPLLGGADCQGIYNKQTSDRRLAMIGYTVGAALAATSLTLFLVAPRSSSVSDRVAFGCAPTLLDAGVACRLSF